MLFVWLVGRLVARLLGWQLGRWVGWAVGWLIGESFKGWIDILTPAHNAPKHDPHHPMGCGGSGGLGGPRSLGDLGFWEPGDMGVWVVGYVC